MKKAISAPPRYQTVSWDYLEREDRLRYRIAEGEDSKQ